MAKPLFPQALSSTFSHRLTNAHSPLYDNLVSARTSKRQTTSRVNYAEDYGDLDLEIDNYDDNKGNEETVSNDFISNDDISQFVSKDVTYDDELNDFVNDDNKDFPLDDDIDDDVEDDEEDEKDETYEDPDAAYDIYRNLILNSSNSSNTNSKINLSNFQGNKEAPTSLPSIYFTGEQIKNPSSSCFKEMNIIPIKLKINTNGAIINDNFLFNINEKLITPELIASIFVQDLDLNKNIETLIITQIKDQIQSYNELFNNSNNSIIDQFLINEKEFHTVLDISTNIGEDFFTDRIEWDLLDSTLSPESFALTIVEDIGLKPEFQTYIACAIYEEIYKVRREMLENPQQLTQTIDSLPYFNLINPDDLNIGIVQGIRYDIKKYGEEFIPSFEKLNEWEIEKRETEKERNLRRRKRETLRVAGGLTR